MCIGIPTLANRICMHASEDSVAIYQIPTVALFLFESNITLHKRR